MIEHVSVRITLPGEGSAVNELPDAFLVQGVRTQEAVRFIVTRCNSLGHPSGEDIEVLIPMTYRDMLEENYDFFRTFASRALTLGVADDLSTNSGSEASY